MASTPLLVRNLVSKLNLDIRKAVIQNFVFKNKSGIETTKLRQNLEKCWKNAFPASNKKNKTTFVWKVPPL